MPTQSDQTGPAESVSEGAVRAEAAGSKPTGGNGQNGGGQPGRRQGAAVKKPATVVSKTRVRTIAILNRDRPMAWLTLLVLLLLSAVPMYTLLGADRSLNTRQSRVLEQAEETWQHRHMMYQGEVTLESLVPIYDGQPQLVEPPGMVWLYQFVFESLDPLTAERVQLVYQMRLLGAFCGVLLIGSVFWAGYSIGGVKTASFAALAALSCPVLVWFAREGTPNVPLVAMQTLGVASAMWALRPLRPTPSVSRQAIGWGVCGLSLGAVLLAGGLTAVPAVLLPVLVITVMCPGRISHLLGWIAAVFIAGLMVMPWALYVHHQDTGVWEQWVATLWPRTMQSFGGMWEALRDRGLWVLVLMAPWTLWLFGSIAQPFSASSSGVRRRVFIGWAWLLCAGLLAVTGPGEVGLSGVLNVLPAAALLIGQCLRIYSDRSAEARHARIWRHVRWGHLILLALASVALPAGLFFQDALVDRGVLPYPVVAAMPWFFWVGLGVSLLLLTGLSMRFALKHYPGKATVCWAVWSVVLMAVMLIPLSRGPLMKPSAETSAGDATIRLELSADAS